MRLVTYESAKGESATGGTCLGAWLVGDKVLDLRAANSAAGKAEQPSFASMQALIEGGVPALDAARALVEASPESALHNLVDIRLRAPLPVPTQMRDFLCFELHLKQAFESVLKLRAQQADDPVTAEAALRDSGRFDIPEIWYQQPIYYKSNRFAISGPEDEIRWPAYSQIMDYELEMAAVIGTAGRDIAREDASAHIFGYTILNDFSARDAQAIEMEGMLGPAKGKDFDGANALGPCIVTADEIGDPYDLTMTARVNGEEWSRGNSGTMHWRFEDMIAFVSRSETLYAGEVIGSGTVGNGCGLELMRFLEDGDIVELEIDKIGVLRNRVVSGAA